MVESGKRVSNTWIICLLVGDNSAKAGLIPHKTLFRKERSQRFSEQSERSLKDESGSHQLVGGVTAHQGYDG